MHTHNVDIPVAEKQEVRQLLNLISAHSDQQAFRQLFERYHTWLFTVAFTIIQSNEDAEEVLEDVFVKIWEIRDRYSEINNIETYLYTAIKNKCYDRLREKGRIQQVPMEELLVEVDFMESPEETLLYKELEKHIKQSIAKLPPKCREVYLLIKESGSSYKDAAETLSVSQKTIESQMRIAVRKIAEDIHQYLEDRESADKGRFLSFSVFLLA